MHHSNFYYIPYMVTMCSLTINYFKHFLFYLNHTGTRFINKYSQTSVLRTFTVKHPYSKNVQSDIRFFNVYSGISVLRTCTVGPLFYGHVQADLRFTDMYSKTSVLEPCIVRPLFYGHVQLDLCFTDMNRQISILWTCTVGLLLYRYVQSDLCFADMDMFYVHVQSDLFFVLQKQGHSVSKFGVSNKFRVCLSRLRLNFLKYFLTINDIFHKRTVKFGFNVPNRQRHALN